MGGERAATAGGGGTGAESWLRLSEGLVAGVHHALNNRMAALRAVGQVLDADLPRDHPFAGALGTEIQRLEQTAALLALLGRDEREPEPILVEDVLGDVARLFEMHHSLRDRRLSTHASPGLMPVLAFRASLLHALLLLVAHTARDGARAIRLHAEGDDRVVRIVATAAEPGDPDPFDDGLQGIDLAGIEQVLTRAGGTLTVEGGEVTASVPTLAEGRRLRL